MTVFGIQTKLEMISIREFLYDLPQKVRPEAIEDVNTILHFDISGDGGGTYTLKIENGSISVLEGLQGEAKSAIRSSDKVFNELLTKETNPMMAVMTGKLKVSNPGEIMKYIKLLGLM